MEKVEVQQQSGADSPSILTQEIPPRNSDSSDPIQESLRILSEEALQLSEFFWQEEKLVKELCVLLKRILKRVSISFNLPADILVSEWKSKRIFLNAEAHIILINDKNEVTSKALEDLPPQTIFSIVSFIIPELSKSLTSYRRKITSRIGLFERINQELKNLSKIFSDSPKKPEEDTSIEDSMRKELVNQQRDSIHT